MIDVIFNFCVDLLVRFAKLLGITYNEINVWIFVIVVPLVFLIMLFIIIKQLIRIKRLKKTTQNFKIERSNSFPSTL